MRQRKTLHERVVNYPMHAPTDAIELISTDTSDLKKLIESEIELEAVLDIRRDFLDAIRSYEKKSITSPEIVLELLEERIIRPVTKKWLVYGLNNKRERRLISRKNSDEMVYQTMVSSKVPKIEELNKQMTLAQGGSYLLIWGGAPDNNHEVALELSKLYKNLPIADILFWKLTQGEPATLYSVRAKIGNKGGTPVEFPSEKFLETITDNERG
jgi:hypothetical protein